MARIASDQVDAAIQALARDGFSGPEIHRALVDGKAGLPAPLGQSAPALRTVQAKRSRAVEELRRAGDPLQGRDEIETIDALLHDSMRVALAELERINDRHARGKATPKDAMSMREWTRTAAEIRKHFSAVKGQNGTRKQQQHARDASGRSAQPTSTLGRLAAALAREGAGEGESVRPASDRPASSSHLPSSEADGSEAEPVSEANEHAKQSESEGEGEGAAHPRPPARA